MILLHRLSYLKFNNRQMSLSGVKIITPNPALNTHINELSTELDIDTIQRFTVEEYYISLINRYRYLRNSDFSSHIATESTLPSDLLGEVYSPEFMLLIQQQYHTYWESILKNIDEKQLSRSFMLHKIKYPTTAIHKSTVKILLEEGINQIIKEFNKRMTEYQETLKQKSELEERCKRTDELCSYLLDDKQVVRNKMKETVHIELGAIHDHIVQINDSLKDPRAKLKELTAQTSNVSDEIQKLEKEIDSILHNYDRYSNFDLFSSFQNIISNNILISCNDDILQIQSIEKQIQKTPIYNFVKRTALRRQLQEAKGNFSNTAKQYLDSLITQKEEEKDQLSNAMHNEEWVELTNTLKTADNEIAQLKQRQNALEECISDLDSLDDINQILVLSVDTENEMMLLVTEHERIVSLLKQQLKQKNDFQKKLTNLNEHSQLPYSEDISYLEICKKEVTKLEEKEIYVQVIEKALQTAYNKHNIEYTPTNFRHKLFLRLFLCTLYYNRIIPADTYLNIDEAQDISKAEYLLLRRIHGETCVFNLYGDINQSLFPEKSIMDWKDLKEVIGNHIYILNENYRNTLQITEYCNKEFSAEIYPIGISGDPVFTMNAKQAINWLINLKRRNPMFRAAIIIHREEPTTTKLLTDMLAKHNVSWYSADDKKISVLSVENAKGLEFEAVVVFSAGMEINEQYIAYTRALDHLCIVE